MVCTDIENCLAVDFMSFNSIVLLNHILFLYMISPLSLVCSVFYVLGTLCFTSIFC